MIKFILFDLDETIFDFPLAERLAISEVLESFGIEADERTVKRYSEINRECWDALERGELSRERIVVLRFERLFSELSCPDLSPDEAQARYLVALGSKHPFIEGAERVLSELSEKYKLYAVTNGLYAVQTRRIKDAGLDRFFSGYFISEEIGYSKPSREFFLTAFAKIPNFDPDLAIVVGDSLRSDILGAKNAGVKSCLYNPKKKENKTDILPDYEISALEELFELLEKL